MKVILIIGPKLTRKQIIFVDKADNMSQILYCNCNVEAIKGITHSRSLDTLVFAGMKQADLTKEQWECIWPCLYPSGQIVEM